MSSIERRSDSSAESRRRLFLLGVLGDEVDDDDARIVQHDFAERDPVGEARALEDARTAEIDVGARLDQRIEVRGRDHLGEQRRRGQHRLDLVFTEDAMVLVLDHENAERLPGAQHRHAEERAVGVFPRFRTVGEGGMRRRILEAQRFGFGGNQAHKAFTEAQRRLVHRFALQPARCKELKRAVVAQNIERADVCPHVVGDQIDDLVEAVLRGERFRHGFAQLAQKHTRTADRCRHNSPLQVAPRYRQRGRRGKRPSGVLAVQPVIRMEGAHRKLGIFALDQD